MKARDRWVGLLLGALILAGTTGCGGDEEPTPEPATDEEVEVEEPEVEDVPEPSPLGEVMRGHYERAVSARDALVRADIEQAREDMNWLATHDGGDTLPENLQPRFAAMQTEAAAFGESETLTEAGQTFARTLVRCGECHTAIDRFPEIASGPIPEGDSTAAHMRRHQWASTRMWTGLITANPETFREGTGALLDVPLHEHQIPGAEGHAPETIEGLTDHVHELSEQALDAEDEMARAAIYGRYLATCGSCHRLVGSGPAAPAEVDRPAE